MRVDFDNTHTNGFITLLKKSSAGMIVIVTRSGVTRAIRFGTSSPMISDKYVMIVTTKMYPSVLASSLPIPSAISCCANGSENRAPPNAPLMIPINVIPTWTVDNKSVGSFACRKAISALRLPLDAAASSRLVLEEMSAIFRHRENTVQYNEKPNNR